MAHKKERRVLTSPHDTHMEVFGHRPNATSGRGFTHICMSSIDTSSWKEFKVSEVFGKAKLGKYHNPSDLEVDINGYPYICASNQNNGINAQMPRVNGKDLTLTPAKIIAWGKQCPMFTYHNKPCVTSQGMYYLDMTAYSEDVALFICSVLTHSCGNGKYSYSNCLIGSIMDETVISLPVKETEEIDWEYMQERISELEQERISELEQYLIATGLNDYELTDEDGGILDKINSFSWKEFRLADIAELNNGNKMDKNKMSHLDPEINFVSRTATNNGISDVVDKIDGVDPYPSGCITLAFGGSVGSCFLQEAPFYTGQNVGVISLSSDVSKNAKLFFALALGKKCKSSFHAFGNEINKHFKTDLSVNLPVTPSGTPDWSFMEKYIRAIEKVTIADVVKYKDEIIQKTKEAVA